MIRLIISVLALSFGLAARAADPIVNIALIYPEDAPNARPEEYFYGAAGLAARRGAQLAAGETGWIGQQEGIDFRVLMASAPNAASAGRAAERLIVREDVKVLIGGFEASQAEVLSNIAAQYDVLFLNVSSHDRHALIGSNTINLAPSTEALISMIAERQSVSDSRWLVLYLDNELGQVRLQVAAAVLDGQAEIHTRSIVPGSPVFSDVLEYLNDNPGVAVLSLLDWRHHLEFVSQLGERVGLMDLWLMPDSVVGTREYLGIVRRLLPGWKGPIIAPWDASVIEGHELNARFESAFGVPMDTPAWAAYEAVYLAFSALTESETASGNDLKHYLKENISSFDMNKGGTLSLDDNGELMQEVYLLEFQPLENHVSTLERQRNRVKVGDAVQLR